MGALTRIASRDGATLVEGEFPLTAGDFHIIAALLHEEAGIALPEGKATLVYSRLAKRLRVLGLRSFREYCALAAGPEGAEERRHMLTALTTNVTRFFREPHHFDHMRTVLLPPLLEEAKRGGKVRIWSAACSSGQEPYSIAMTILSLMPEAPRFDVKILATDIDPMILSEARAGFYAEAALEGVPPALRQRWFERAGDGRWAVADPARGLVHFRELNLIGAWPMRGFFQAIMCRNVVIYFEEGTQAGVWQRFVPLLAPGGHLYIGHSERVNGPAAGAFESTGITVYRKRGGAAP
ncbi:CheR family methyltransferase [Muricoccus radiodurans]|uniref:CheR family methyltransferase n=1 Tax=Muricoccus radiodurans TaxID=2231721 RepID=UPI003CF2B297